MTSFVYSADDEQATDRLGRVLAEVLPAGTVVALIGTLGAGKTRLTQAIAAALGVPPDVVTSPTFVLINEYRQGRLPIYHFDAYRLADVDEFAELGPEEYFESPGICLVEWADRVALLLPEDVVRIEISVAGEQQREFTISGRSDSSERVVEELATTVSQAHDDTG